MLIPFCKRKGQKQWLVLLATLVAATCITFFVRHARDASEAARLSAAFLSVCRVIEPRIQIGAVREVANVIEAVLLNFDSRLQAITIFLEGGRKTTLGNASGQTVGSIFCPFVGRADVKVEMLIIKPSEEPALLMTVVVFFWVALFFICLLAEHFFKRGQYLGVEIFEHILTQNLIEHPNSDQGAGRPTWLGKLHLRSRLAEEIKIKVDELEASLRAKSDELAEQRVQAALAKSAAQVAHDIRSPLSALNMVVGTINDLQEEQKAVIKAAINRVNAIANDLLNQSKANSRGELPDPHRLENKADAQRKARTVIDVRRNLEELLIEKKAQFRERSDVRIELDIDADSVLLCEIEGTLFDRVMSNLINNSYEAISGEGAVVIKAFRNERDIVVQVQDNGSGIPPDQIEKIGTRGISYGKGSMESGSGLGLSFSIETAERHGGRLEIRSELGSGTLISLILPLAENQSRTFISGPSEERQDDRNSSRRLARVRSFKNGFRTNQSSG